ncbi:MAG: ribosome maturation factor RimP [Clostridia bacterium]|nr:ribosome maturation factor RimP [Clostridia bacterium]
MSEKTTDIVDKLLRAKIEELGYEIVDIEFVKKYGQMNLTVFIDIPRGVTLDDCELVHNAVNPILDEADPIKDAYVLNISSPGLDRPFKRQRDFERNYGKEVEVKLYAPLRGKKLYEGILKEKTENFIIIETPDKEDLKLEMTRIALVRPLVRFE